MTALVIDILVMAPTITYRHNMAGKAIDDGGKEGWVQFNLCASVIFRSTNIVGLRSEGGFKVEQLSPI